MRGSSSLDSFARVSLILGTLLACALVVSPLQAQSPPAPEQPPANPEAVALPAPVLESALEEGVSLENTTSNTPVAWLASSAFSLAPHLSFFLDEGGTRTLTDMFNQEEPIRFFRSRPNTWFKENAAVWLKFSLAVLEDVRANQTTPTGESERLYVDLGRHIPQGSQVWLLAPPVPGGQESIPILLEPAWRNVYAVTDTHGNNLQGDILIRLNGLTDVWFSPVIRTLPEAMQAPERLMHSAGLAVLAVLAALCLIRCLFERGEGRIWAGLFLLAAFVYARSGVPMLEGGEVPLGSLPAVAGAGIALMLLPHVGRITMRTYHSAPWLDTLLQIMALPGAILAVLPLLPDMAWTSILLSLWPLGAVMPLSVAVVLAGRDVPGSGLYAMACLGLAVCTAFSLWGMGRGLHPQLMGELPLWGINIAAFILAVSPRFIYAWTDTEVLPSPAGSAEDHPEHTSTPVNPVALLAEENLRPPLEDLMKEAQALNVLLEDHEMSEAGIRRARHHIDSLLSAGKELSALVSGIPYMSTRQGKPDYREQTFELRRLVRSVVSGIQTVHSGKNLGLSWYVAPHMGLYYRGDEDRLRFLLSLMLEDAARGTHKGMVSLRVQRSPDSTDPGCLQFTVSDNGQGLPPTDRSSLMLARAWEIAAAGGGTLRVSGGPQGLTITFSLQLIALADDGETPVPVPPGRLQPGLRDPNPELVLVGSPTPMTRQLISFYLKEDESRRPRQIWEAQSAGEVVELYMHSPAALILLDGSLPEDDIIRAIAAIRSFEGEREIPPAPVLALCPEGSQADRLFAAGCHDCLPLPPNRATLAAVLHELADGNRFVGQPTSRHRFAASSVFRSVPLQAASVPPFADETESTDLTLSGTHEVPRPKATRTEVQESHFSSPDDCSAQGSLYTQGAPEKAKPPVQPLIADNQSDSRVKPDELRTIQSPPDSARTPSHETPTPAGDQSAQPDAAEFLEQDPLISLPSQRLPASEANHRPMPGSISLSDASSQTPPSLEVFRSPRKGVSTPGDGPIRITASPEPHSQGHGLQLAPPPKKRLSWLNKVFKPTPVVHQTDGDGTPYTRSSSEWVGEPVPVDPPVEHVSSAERSEPMPSPSRESIFPDPPPCV